MAYKVATSRQFGHEIGLTLRRELFNKVDHLVGSLAQVHSEALAHLVKCLELIVFCALYGFDGDTRACDLVDATLNRVAAVRADLLHDFVLIQRA